MANSSDLVDLRMNGGTKLLKTTVDIEIITHSQNVEAMLEPYRDRIGADFEGYRNHIYRVLTFALHFLGDDQQHRAVIETALVYHDIGLWTDRELAYLEPSIVVAQRDNQANDWGHDPQLLHDIILWHHKMTPYKGPHAELVNAVRKADWIDATRGTIRMGMPKNLIRRVQEAIPEAGFMKTLMRLGPELGGNPLRMLARFAKVYKR